MKKIYIVRLTDDERETCLAVIKKLKGSSEKVRRAHILLKADADGPNWKDQDIADAFLCSRQTIENVRKRLVTEGFDSALNGNKSVTPRPKLLTGEQDAKITALRLSEPPEGRNSWTLRLLADKVVELQIVPHISHVTIRRLLKKQHNRSACSVLVHPTGSERRVRYNYSIMQKI